MLQLSNGKESVYTCKCSILQSYLNKVQISNTYSSQQLELLDVRNSKCSLLGAFPPSTTDNLINIINSDTSICTPKATVSTEYLNYFCTASARVQGYPNLSDANVLPALNFSPQVLPTYLNAKELKMSLQEKPYVRLSVSVPESIVLKVCDFLKAEALEGKPENLFIDVYQSSLQWPVFSDVINTSYLVPKFRLYRCKLLWVTPISVMSLETATSGIARVESADSTVKETFLYGYAMKKYQTTVPYAEYIQNLGDRVMNFIEQVDPDSLKKSFVSVRRVEFKNQNTSNTQRQQNSALEEWGFARDVNISLLHNELE